MVYPLEIRYKHRDENRNRNGNTEIHTEIRDVCDCPEEGGIPSLYFRLEMKRRRCGLQQMIKHKSHGTGILSHRLRGGNQANEFDAI